MAQIRDHVVVEGQANTGRQVAQIIATIETYLLSIHTSQLTKIKSQQAAVPPGIGPPKDGTPGPEGLKPTIEATIPRPRVINLIRVLGPQQVMLKVQVAELNRTALRQIGTSFLFQDGSSGVGSNIGGSIPAIPTGTATAGFARLLNPLNAGSTVFGVFNAGSFNYFIDALRENQVFKVLAEPNLIALNGHQADFLAGGEFPVIVPQAVGGSSGTFTTEFRDFGVNVKFIPHIIDVNTIRLAVSVEVSDLDFSVAATLAPGASPTPGKTQRKVNTVVELKHGQTLAIAGLLQVTVEGSTSRIPGLGDLPYIGAMFSNSSTRAVEKELILMVTPTLVAPVDTDQMPPKPGDEVWPPDDEEFYLHGRIEGRLQTGYRATTAWDDLTGIGGRLRLKYYAHKAYDDPSGITQRLNLENHFLTGPSGYSD